MPGWFLRRTAERSPADFYNINGIWRVVVLEREGRLRIERSEQPLCPATHTPSRPVTLKRPRWFSIGRLREFAMWCLLAFCGSGVYLWLTAQAIVVGRASLATGTASFALM
jgi:hypothetical protein